MQAEISSLNESEQQLIEENRKLKEQVHNGMLLIFWCK